MKTILLVEDAQRLRELYRDALIESGYTVVTAENGEEGVAVAKSSKPDLILMDMHMPIMDGLEATRQIRALDGRSTQIIALTSAAMPDEVELGLAAGCDGYIVKPLHPADLIGELSNALDLLSQSDSSTEP